MILLMWFRALLSVAPALTAPGANV